MKTFKRLFDSQFFGFIFIFLIIGLSIDVILTESSHAAPSIVNEKDNEIINTHRETFNVAVAGDFGCGKNANKTVNNMLTKQPKMVIALGDLSYQKTADYWFNVVSPLDTDGRIKIAIGDNEMYPSKYAKYLNHFNLTNPFYSFTIQM